MEEDVNKKKYLFVTCMLLAIFLASAIFTKIYVSLESGGEDEEKLHIVTSFYPVYIAAKNVVEGSDGVTLENLSEPQTGCMHDYQLTPQDMILLSNADLFLVNGGGIENFLEEVGEAYPNLTIVKIMGEEEAENPHGWMDTRKYAEMVGNIADAVSNADQDHDEFYHNQAESYCVKIEELTSQAREIREEFLERNKQQGESRGNSLVIFHEAYEYLAEEVGMEVVYCLDLDEERQVSAGEMADMMEEIEKNQVSAVFAEELYGKKTGDIVEKETDCKVYYLDTLVRGNYDEADSYLQGMQKNLDTIRAILEQ